MNKLIQNEVVNLHLFHHTDEIVVLAIVPEILEIYFVEIKGQNESNKSVFFTTEM